VPEKATWNPWLHLRREHITPATNKPSTQLSDRAKPKSGARGQEGFTCSLKLPEEKASKLQKRFIAGVKSNA